MEHDPTATDAAAMDTDIALSRFGPDGTLDPRANALKMLYKQ
jgi:hypothetical protein